MILLVSCVCVHVPITAYLFCIHNTDAEEDAVIVNVKKNALLVMVPKYGLKGIIRVRSKEGRSVLPPGLLPGVIGTCDVDLDQQHQQLKLSCGSVSTTLNLFDHLVVRLETSDSRAHVPALKFTLTRICTPGERAAPQSVAPINIAVAVTKAFTKVGTLPAVCHLLVKVYVCVCLFILRRRMLLP